MRKLVRKVLRTLPKKFAHKVTGTEEAQDLTTMRIDELMENLTTFEMTLDDGESRKKNGVALKAISEDVNDEDLPNVNDKGNNRWKKPVNHGNFNVQQKDKLKGIQYRECEEFEHIQVECPNYVKRQSKNNYTTLTDNDSDDDEDQEEKVSNFVAFTAKSEPPFDDSMPEDSEDEEEITEEELLEDYCNDPSQTKWIGLTTVFTKSEVQKGKLNKEILKLIKTVMDRDKEIMNLNAQLQSLNKGIKMMIQVEIFLK
ncbi:hypothetical protein LIER_10060 [Lithospermum erythrorhizon]|uniref:Gag-pol polyprotein n=1 Tax=Lithospermum erythrorhizon TaxID=34254 RepID=A0AAV3PMW2_LITER